ncbi:hypothetical protein [Fortiea contorta]|uniref:hypothetical protein n=1 Tax=Fortiea contorta TaxID=1892405 RepID=UPI00036D87F3|nr:hypothetical protein [Fortiea contorta]
MPTNSKPLELLYLSQSFGGRAIKDAFFKPQNVYEVEKHLEAAVQWLKRAHDSSPDDGVSWGYSLKGGWRQSYRETSGYIAETFLDLAKQRQDNDAWERTITICKWLIKVQNEDGSISDPRYGATGIVFDTGQVLQGLIKVYEETGNPDFLKAAEAAGDWLVRVADATGRWTKNTHLGIPHVYNARVAWQLLKLHTVRPSTDRERVGRANLDWAVSQQKDGWFDQCAFRAGDAPFTHNIAYALRGLLESGYLMNDQKYLDAATAGAMAMIPHVTANGFIPGQFDSKGQPVGKYCCLTGNCQMAIIWLKLFRQTGDRIYYDAAKKSLQYVMSTQDIHTSNLNMRGGIKGSQPIWGTYTRLSYPNWATKFFIDGLLLLLQTPS